MAAQWACKRCGKCCEIYNPFNEDHKGRCPKLVGTKCSIHDKERPKICVEYFCNKGKGKGK